jgi:hypothetical protein
MLIPQGVIPRETAFDNDCSGSNAVWGGWQGASASRQIAVVPMDALRGRPVTDP